MKAKLYNLQTYFLDVQFFNTVVKYYEQSEVDDELGLSKLIMNEYKLEKLVQLIVKRFVRKIDDFPCIRDYIDYKYKKTKKGYIINLINFLLLYVMPFFIYLSQDQKDDRYLYCCLYSLSNIFLLKLIHLFYEKFT